MPLRAVKIPLVVREMWGPKVGGPVHPAGGRTQVLKKSIYSRRRPTQFPDRLTQLRSRCGGGCVSASGRPWRWPPERQPGRAPGRATGRLGRPGGWMRPAAPAAGGRLFGRSMFTLHSLRNSRGFMFQPRPRCGPIVAPGQAAQAINLSGLPGARVEGVGSPAGVYVRANGARERTCRTADLTFLAQPEGSGRSGRDWSDNGKPPESRYL